MQISEIHEVNDEVVEAFDRLVPQLSSSSPPPSRAQLAEMVSSDASHVLVARDPEQGDRITGSLTLVVFRIPTGVRAWIEDVVVEERARGKGIGAALTQAALDLARQLGAKTVDLTSRPTREVANRLYQRVGFEQRHTNVYRYKLDS